MLPLRRSFCRTSWTSKVACFASRAPRAIFSKSQKTARLRSPFTNKPHWTLSILVGPAVATVAMLRAQMSWSGKNALNASSVDGHRCFSKAQSGKVCGPRSGGTLGGILSGGMDARCVLLSCRLGTLLVQHRLDERIPLFHRAPLFGHVVPTIVALRADVLESVVLYAITNFFRQASLARKRLPGSAQIAVGHDWNHLALALTPHEGIERAVADRLGRFHGGGEEPAVRIRLDRLD